jgi:hypothetical protein
MSPYFLIFIVVCARTSEVFDGYFTVIAKAINGEVTVHAPGKGKGGG